MTHHWSRPRVTRVKPKIRGADGLPTNRELPTASTDQTIILVHAAKQVNKSNAFMDRGANGGVAGGNMRPISWTNRMVDLNGVDEHTVRELRIRTFGAVTESQCGPIIAIFPQMAYMPEGKTIISCPQVEHHKNTVNEKSPHVTGKTPCITTLEGYRIPITARNGLPHIQMRTYTDKEWESLPRVQLTSEKDWDPSILDAPVPKEWYDRMRSNQRS